MTVFGALARTLATGRPPRGGFRELPVRYGDDTPLGVTRRVLGGLAPALVALYRPGSSRPGLPRRRARPDRPLTALTPRRQQRAERTQVDVQLLTLEPELLQQLHHPLIEPHQGVSEPFGLLVGDRTLLHPAQRLPLHQLPQQFHDSEDESR